jgi:hypothetical protein
MYQNEELKTTETNCTSAIVPRYVDSENEKQKILSS